MRQSFFFFFSYLCLIYLFISYFGIFYVIVFLFFFFSFLDEWDTYFKDYQFAGGSHTSSFCGKRSGVFTHWTVSWSNNK